MPTNKEIEEALRKAGKQPVEYPAGDKAARRAELQMMTRQALKDQQGGNGGGGKKDGCPLRFMALAFVIVPALTLLGGVA